MATWIAEGAMTFEILQMVSASLQQKYWLTRFCFPFKVSKMHFVIVYSVTWNPSNLRFYHLEGQMNRKQDSSA